MAQFTITVDAKENLPPSSVGDGAENTDYGVTLVYTRAMFTTNTIPPYADPDGDAALNLKIITLPTEGILQLNSVNVTLNQIIAFTDIDSGLLTYVPNNANINAHTDTFEFQISDTGSQIFVG